MKRSSLQSSQPSFRDESSLEQFLVGCCRSATRPVTNSRQKQKFTSEAGKVFFLLVCRPTRSVGETVSAGEPELDQCNWLATRNTPEGPQENL